jgi:hypothetical protein
VKRARLLLALLLVLLPACAATNVSAPPASAERAGVVWYRVENPQAVCEDLSGRREFFKILGCSKWIAAGASGAERQCAIYAPEPRDERDVQRFATLGHELMHCLDGNWHDQWGRMLDAKVRARASAGGSEGARGISGAAAAE